MKVATKARKYHDITFTWIHHSGMNACYCIQPFSSCKCHIPVLKRWSAGPTETIDLGETESWEDSCAWHGFWREMGVGIQGLQYRFLPQGQQPEEKMALRGYQPPWSLKKALFFGDVGIRVLRFPWYSPQLRSDAPVMHPWKGLLDPIVGPIGV